MAIDYTKLIEKLDPREDGEDQTRPRTAVVSAVNTNGTLDIVISGVVVPNVPKLASVGAAPGSVVQVQSSRGSLLVIGVTTPSAGAIGGIIGVPTTSTVDGTATAANTTEVRDAILGNYVFTASAGHWYEPIYSGALANLGAANSRVVARIRDGGASTPTAASTAVGEWTNYCVETGTAGRNSTLISGRPRQFTTGVHTLSLFTHSIDSAAATPVVDTLGTRMLYVKYLGPVN